MLPWDLLLVFSTHWVIYFIPYTQYHLTAIPLSAVEITPCHRKMLFTAIGARVVDRPVCFSTWNRATTSIQSFFFLYTVSNYGLLGEMEPDLRMKTLGRSNIFSLHRLSWVSQGNALQHEGMKMVWLQNTTWWFSQYDYWPFFSPYVKLHAWLKRGDFRATG